MYLKDIKNKDKEIYKLILKEQKRQNTELELIASENYVFPEIMQAMGSILTNKYSEGYPKKRYYAGNEVIDEIEQLAIDRAKKIFGADHINIQPLSGAPANIAVFLAFLQYNDTILSLSLDQGGHLSHGHPINFSGKFFNVVNYNLNKKTEMLDMKEVRKLAKKHKPKLIIAGYSGYSREIPWQEFSEIAKEVNAYSMADISHTAGLIAAKQMHSPIPYFDVITTTTHKTLRGPRGAIIMCKKKYRKLIDKSVFPGVQGGPHDHINCAKAIAFGEVLKPEFTKYAKTVIKNASILCESLQNYGFRIISNGTDNHLMLIDMTNKEMTGKETEQTLSNIGISCNKNMIPFDPRTAFDPSGIRIGTPAITTRGMKGKEMKILAKIINDAIENKDNPKILNSLKNKVKNLAISFPVPS